MGQRVSMCVIMFSKETTKTSIRNGKWLPSVVLTHEKVRQPCPETKRALGRRKRTLRGSIDFFPASKTMDIHANRDARPRKYSHSS